MRTTAFFERSIALILLVTTTVHLCESSQCPGEYSSTMTNPFFRFSFEMNSKSVAVTYNHPHPFLGQGYWWSGVALSNAQCMSCWKTHGSGPISLLATHSCSSSCVGTTRGFVVSDFNQRIDFHSSMWLVFGSGFTVPSGKMPASQRGVNLANIQVLNGDVQWLVTNDQNIASSQWPLTQTISSMTSNTTICFTLVMGTNTIAQFFTVLCTIPTGTCAKKLKPITSVPKVTNLLPYVRFFMPSSPCTARDLDMIFILSATQAESDTDFVQSKKWISDHITLQRLSYSRINAHLSADSHGKMSVQFRHSVITFGDNVSELWNFSTSSMTSWESTLMNSVRPLNDSTLKNRVAKTAVQKAMDLITQDSNPTDGRTILIVLMIEHLPFPATENICGYALGLIRQIKSMKNLVFTVVDTHQAQVRSFQCVLPEMGHSKYFISSATTFSLSKFGSPKYLTVKNHGGLNATCSIPDCSGLVLSIQVNEDVQAKNKFAWQIRRDDIQGPSFHMKMENQSYTTCVEKIENTPWEWIDKQCGRLEFDTEVVTRILISFQSNEGFFFEWKRHDTNVRANQQRSLVSVDFCSKNAIQKCPSQLILSLLPEQITTNDTHSHDLPFYRVRPDIQQTSSEYSSIALSSGICLPQSLLQKTKCLKFILDYLGDRSLSLKIWYQNVLVVSQKETKANAASPFCLTNQNSGQKVGTSPMQVVTQYPGWIWLIIGCSIALNCICCSVCVLIVKRMCAGKDVIPRCSCCERESSSSKSGHTFLGGNVHDHSDDESDDRGRNGHVVELPPKSGIDLIEPDPEDSESVSI